MNYLSMPPELLQMLLMRMQAGGGREYALPYEPAGISVDRMPPSSLGVAEYGRMPTDLPVEIPSRLPAARDLRNRLKPIER